MSALNPTLRTVLLLSFLLLAACSRTHFRDAQGKTLEWSSLRGQWVVINYWATWCKECKEAIPELNNLDQRPNVTVLGVNFPGKQGAALRQAVEKMGIQYRVLTQNPAKALGWETPIVLPASFLVNPKGKLLEARFDATTEKAIMDRIHKAQNAANQ